MRQPGSVAQRYLSVDLIRGQAPRGCTDAGTQRRSGGRSRRELPGALQELRALIADVAEDPLPAVCDRGRLVAATAGRSAAPGRATPSTRSSRRAEGLDLVGIYAAGTMCRGFANSFGQRNWHAVRRTSPRLEPVRAHRQGGEVDATPASPLCRNSSARGWPKPARASRTSERRAAHAGSAGRLQCVPVAGSDAGDRWTCSAGAASPRARQVKQSPLQRMLRRAVAAEQRCSTMAENAGGGVAPAFQGEGYLKPASLPLIAGGLPGSTMISPRTAREFALADNGANGAEAPGSIDDGRRHAGRCRCAGRAGQRHLHRQPLVSATTPTG